MRPKECIILNGPSKLDIVIALVDPYPSIEDEHAHPFSGPTNHTRLVGFKTNGVGDGGESGMIWVAVDALACIDRDREVWSIGCHRGPTKYEMKYSTKDRTGTVAEISV